jgi:hypothetical protein
MTRDDVARRRGDPPGYATRAARDRAPVWVYTGGPFDSYEVRFRNGRVTSFTKPATPP